MGIQTFLYSLEFDSGEKMGRGGRRYERTRQGIILDTPFDELETLRWSFHSA